MKKILLIILFQLFFVGCSNVENQTNGTEYGWSVKVNDVLIGSLLSKDKIIENYDGTSQIDSQSRVASPQNTFYLFDLEILKNKNSKSSWEWKNLRLEIDGIEYRRYDDSFLTLLEYPRMVGTDINFGTHSGWILFEAPPSNNKYIFLIYEDEFGENRIQLKNE